MDQWIEQYSTIIPLAALLSGLGSSLHCVSMCGGLVSASCHQNKDIYTYQIGRLIGYLVLGVASGFLGSLVKIDTHNPYINLLPSLMIGLVFIFWGVQSLLGFRTRIPVPQFFSGIYKLLWRKSSLASHQIQKSFLVGMASIFLPCGVLYAVILGSMSLQSAYLSAIVMVFFWLGTLPAMILAPHLVRKFLSPLKSKSPKVYAVSLILIGLGTVGFRAMNQMAHSATHVEQSSAPSCH